METATKTEAKPLPQQENDWLYERDFIRIEFQHGLPPEVGINGVRIEDVLDAALRRLERYQNSDLACKENEEAVAGIVAAKDAMVRRRQRRQSEGVFQTYEPHTGERSEDLHQDFSSTGA